MIAPSDEDVDNVISILELDYRDRALVMSALQAKNNNVEQVVNEYFDSPDKFRQQYSWDESAFSNAPDGRMDGSDVPYDHQVIQGVEPTSYYALPPPSRPPSRTNNRSPLSKLVEYTAGHSPAMNQPTNSEQENADLQRAIAESVATSGIQSPQPIAPQESGIIQTDTSLPYFGPANRPDYDQNQWAMITLNREAQEPGPSRRKRNDGVPAFLRCRKENLWEKHRLGAILTIFHAIPAARNALLRSGAPAQGYGHNAEWWTGQPIPRLGAPVTPEGGGELIWPEDAKTIWSEELHRLVAFLDATERSYGTADVLADTVPDGAMSSGDNERDFFEYIRNEPSTADEPSPLMATAEVVNIVGDGPSTVNHWGLLEPSFPKEQLIMAENLYNIWDMIFFMDASVSNDFTSAKMATITQPAEVMTIRFSGNDGFPKPLEIPADFYIDRYLAEHKGDMSQIQRDMAALAQSVGHGHQLQAALTQFVDPQTGKPVDRKALCDAAIAKNKQQLWRLKAVARWRKHEDARGNGSDPQYFPMDRDRGAGGDANVDADDDDDDDDDVTYTSEESNLIRAFEADIRFYQRKISDIERRLQKLDVERKACEEVFRDLGSRFTVPSEEQRWNPTHRYSLRGVSNSPDTFYVCVRSGSDSMDMDDTEGRPSPVADQWWKLGFVADDEEPVKAEMTTYEKAVGEACGVGAKPILVYASEKAMRESPDPLSDALQTFIRFDNRLFGHELKDESPREKKRGAFASPSSPSKRLNRSSSLDSMATNLASVSDLDDDDMRDAHFEVEDPFLAGDGSMETELQDLSKPNPAAPAIEGHDIESAYLADASLGEGTASSGQAVAPSQNGTASKADQQQTNGGTQSSTPEMQERSGAPSFLVKPAKGKLNHNEPISMMDMELDEHLGSR